MAKDKQLPEHQINMQEKQDTQLEENIWLDGIDEAELMKFMSDDLPSPPY